MGDPLVVEGTLRLENPTLRFTGVSQCAAPVQVLVTLLNEGDAPESIERTISSCGCARVVVEPGTVVAPGGSIDLPVDFKAWGAPRRKTHDVRFILSGDRLGPILNMDVEITSVLRTIPSAAQKPLHPDGRVRVVSEDGTPFSVVAVEPAVPISWSGESSTQVELVIDWPALEAWLADPRNPGHPGIRLNEAGALDHMQLQVSTDHPGCEQLHLDLFGDRHSRPVWNRATFDS